MEKAHCKNCSEEHVIVKIDGKWHHRKESQANLKGKAVCARKAYWTARELCGCDKPEPKIEKENIEERNKKENQENGSGQDIYV